MRLRANVTNIKLVSVGHSFSSFTCQILYYSYSKLCERNFTYVAFRYILWIPPISWWICISFNCAHSCLEASWQICVGLNCLVFPFSSARSIMFSVRSTASFHTLNTRSEIIFYNLSFGYSYFNRNLGYNLSILMCHKLKIHRLTSLCDD